MEFGFYLPTHGPLAKRDPILKIASHAENIGFDSMVAGDHVIAPINPESQYPLLGQRCHGIVLESI